jgi:RNase P subunit RPR2
MDIRYKTGSEGPWHDPYHYEEWTIIHTSPDKLKKLVDPDLKFVIHRGLVEWFRVESDYYKGFKFEKHHGLEKQWGASVEQWETLLNGYLKRVFGYNMKQIERIYRRVNRPFCKKCKVYPKGQDIDVFPGYPGEEVYVHHTCGNPVGCSQDMSYII